MARRKRFADIKRMLLRRLVNENNFELRVLRDEIWERLIARQFRNGQSIETIASEQPAWNTEQHVQMALRSQIRKTSEYR